MILRASSIRIILWDRLYVNQPVRPNGALPDMAHRHLHLFNTSLVTLVLFSALVGCTEEAAESRFTLLPERWCFSGDRTCKID